VGACARTTPWGQGLALGAVLRLGAAGCGAELPEAALHEALAGWFLGQGVAIDGARCPGAPLPRAAGATVACRVDVGSAHVEVTVTVDDAGALSVRPVHPTLVAARVEPEIAQTLRAQGWVVDRVACEGPLVVARPGAAHRCEVIDGEGRRFAWVGEWSGDGTRQRTRVVPLPGDRGGAP
jgi:hypothetical protein